MKTRILKLAIGDKLAIDRFPNFSKTGNIRGMKEQVYGKNALLVHCGAYIYNVTSAPHIYEAAK